MSVRQRIQEYTGGVGYLIIILILSFGSALVGIGVKLIHGQQRMEQRQTVALAALRAQAQASPGPDEPEPDRRHGMFLVPPVAALAGVALLLRRHWVRTVSAAAGALTASAVVLALVIGHTPTPAGPPLAGQPTTAGLTGATVPAAPSSTPSSSRPAPVARTSSAPAPSSVAAVPVVLTGEAPAQPQPSTAPSSSVPVPSRSPSAPGTPPKSPIAPSPTTPGSTAVCLVAVSASPILAACVL